MIHNNKVYANADEKFVKGTILYGMYQDLYHDIDMTKEVYDTELFELFLNNITVYSIGEDKYYKPIALDNLRLYVIASSGSVVYFNIKSAPTEE